MDGASSSAASSVSTCGRWALSSAMRSRASSSNDLLDDQVDIALAFAFDPSPLRLELCTRGCRTRCQTLSLPIVIASVSFNRGSFNSSRMPFNTALSKSRKLSWRLILRVLAALRVCDEACRCPRAAVSCVRGIRVTLASTRPRRCILAMITVELIRAKRRWSMSQTAPAATIGRRFALVLVSVTSVQAAHCRRS